MCVWTSELSYHLLDMGHEDSYTKHLGVHYFPSPTSIKIFRLRLVLSGNIQSVYNKFCSAFPKAESWVLTEAMKLLDRVHPKTFIQQTNLSVLLPCARAELAVSISCNFSFLGRLHPSKGTIVVNIAISTIWSPKHVIFPFSDFRMINYGFSITNLNKSCITTCPGNWVRSN